MNFNLSDEQQQIADSLERLLTDHCSFEQRRAIAASEPGWSVGLWGQLAELGVTALGIPEAFGGLGGGATDRLPVLQACGRALLLEPYLASSVLAATAVREAGSNAQRDTLLPALASGELRMAFALDETTARHEPLWVETRARQTPQGWRLDGGKVLVLHGAHAHRLVVTARTHGEPGDADGRMLFLVDSQAAGVALRDHRLIDDTAAAELTLRDAVAEPLGDPADGARARDAIAATLAAGTAAVCADMVGTMERAFALTTEYVNTRQQFGRAIGQYQALRHRIAEMAVQLELARSLAIAAAVAADSPDTPESAMDLPRAKLAIGRYARSLCQAAIQSHGGIGMTEEYAVGHCLRRVHVLDQLFGDVGAQAARLVLMDSRLTPTSR
ncbi:acyl-CoA dehydrogenase family protein [Variovorax sp. Sphag1AA]|uniref:acyl-CoA dehydrogenase family protein n=1 Tax=Variovorax sp. Sphag1AA TaxID=2587027 RepID=UPI001612973D|nr:acyl-CoA dehydrogenase family protein [Variovorax sp. Sphag1AA]MBB3178327.1 alkylation response protein AidB-like acyl-CoA dehydrogenase [Variovorax sp. Sphag1AA]